MLPREARKTAPAVTRRSPPWITREASGAWLVLARGHGCLHGDSAAAFNDARWQAHNLGLPIRVRVQS
jgi:hypothetical protein